MNEIITTADSLTAQTLHTGLFNEFVRWIDRGERTTKNYLTNLKHFAAWLAFTGIRAPRRKDVQAYRDWLLQEHEAITLDADGALVQRKDKHGQPIKIICKPNTVRAYLQTVKAFFAWTAAENLYPNIASNIHAPKIAATHRKECLSVEDVQTIEASIAASAASKASAAADNDKDTAGRIQRSTEQSKRLYCMYLLAVTAGLRTIELSRANVKDFITKHGQAWIYVYGKGHSEADTKKAIAPEIAAALEDYLASRTDKVTGNAPLFVSTGNRSHGQRIAATTISTMLKRALLEAGYNSDRLTAHSLRHTAGTAAYKLTGNLFETQHYMRHCSPATTEIYVHVDHEKTDASIASGLYNLYHGRSDSSRAKLDTIIATLTAAQVEQLTTIAAAMA